MKRKKYNDLNEKNKNAIDKWTDYKTQKYSFYKNR